MATPCLRVIAALSVGALTAGCPQGPRSGPENFCAGDNLALREQATAMGETLLGAPSSTAGRDSAAPAPRPWLVTTRPGMALPEAGTPTARFESFGVSRFAFLDGATLARLMAHPAVAAIEEDRPRRIRGGALSCDPVLPSGEVEPWFLGVVRASFAWPRTEGGGALIAVLDTGIDNSHPDLASAVMGGVNLSGSGDLTSGADDNGHGTRVASVIAARRNGQGLVGVAPQVRLFSVKTQDSRGEGTVSTMIAGLQWALEHGAHIANISVGAAGASYAELRAVDTATAQGMVLVGAAGNGGDASEGGLNEAEYPASYRNVISVAAVDAANNRAAFSTYNSFVDIAAPGIPIMAANPEAFGGSYLCDSGTSFSAPQVSAVAALLRQSAPGISTDHLRRALVCGAVDATAPGIDSETGYGVVSALFATNFIDSPRECAYLREPAAPFPAGAPDPQPKPPGSPADGYFRFRVQSLQALFISRGDTQGVLLRGQVLTHTGEPLADVQLDVALFNGSGDLAARATLFTDNEGLFLAFASGATCGALHFTIEEALRGGFSFDRGGSITAADFSF